MISSAARKKATRAVNDSYSLLADSRWNNLLLQLLLYPKDHRTIARGLQPPKKIIIDFRFQFTVLCHLDLYLPKVLAMMSCMILMKTTLCTFILICIFLIPRTIDRLIYTLKNSYSKDCGLSMRVFTFIVKQVGKQMGN